MATIHLFLDSRESKNGFAIKINIRQNDIRKSIATGYYVKKQEQFIGSPDDAVAHSVPGFAVINKSISDQYRKICEMMDVGGGMVTEVPTLVDYFIRIMNEKKQNGTRATYMNTLAHIRTHMGENIRIDKVTTNSIRQFDMNMEADGLSVNSRGIHHRNLKHVINRAIDDNFIRQENYPYKKFKIKKTVKELDSLSADEMRAIINYKPDSSYLRHNTSKDMFLLSFYLGGINLKDLFYMRTEQMTNGVIDYNRIKTGVHVRVKVLEPALEIINRHRGTDGYLLDLHGRWGDDFYEECRNSIVHGITSIRKALADKVHTLSFYYARYTFASIADSLDISERIIAKVVGHADSTITEKHYMKYDWERSFRCQEEVINYVLKVKQS